MTTETKITLGKRQIEFLVEASLDKYSDIEIELSRNGKYLNGKRFKLVESKISEKQWGTIEDLLIQAEAA